MIGSLRGRLAAKSPPGLLLEVGGVGYELEAPMSTFFDLPAVGAEVSLLTHFVVREDAQVLYGFLTEGERKLFRGLLKVTGVGPKLALSILSGTSVEGFSACVAAQDVGALTRIPGVGRKTAERLLIEMRDRLKVDVDSGLPALGGITLGAEAEAQSALIALGYKPAEAIRMLKVASAGESADLSTEEWIRRALQGAARERGGSS
jgi:Holliday junction DNA helicase RuvA